jgi:PAS domain S-box-containing protein
MGNSLACWVRAPIGRAQRRHEERMASSAERVHPRTIGWVGTTALAMGGSNQSLFLLGALLAGQGTGALPLLIAGLLLAWMAAPGWTELIMMWPNRVGGIAATCAEAFRPYSPVLANLSGVCYWWGWVPTCGLTAILSASALHQWYLPSVPVQLLASVIVLAFTGVNLCGIKWVTRVAVPMAAVSATLAFLSGVIPVVTGHVDWRAASSFTLKSPFTGTFGHLTSAMAGLYLIGFAAPAFEAAACHVGETIDAKRNVPRAMLASALMASMYFIALPVIWLGVIGPSGLGGDLATTLGPTFGPVFGGAARSAAIWFMVMNMFHGTMQPLAGAARTLSQLSEDGLLPRVLAWRNRNDAPWAATTLTGAMAIAFLMTGDPTWVIAAANLTYLIGICLPSVAAWLLRRNEPGRERPYRAPRGTIVLGVIAAAVWGISTLLGFEQFGLPTVLAGIALACSGAVLYAARRWSDRRREGRPRLARSLHVKLTGAMLLVLSLDGAGYLIAVSRIDKGPHVVLVALLEDIFVAVALLTIAVGLVMPGLIVHAVQQVSEGANRLATGTLADLTRAMGALAAGDLDQAHTDAEYPVIRVTTLDEIGAMAHNFNAMQEEVARAARSLEGAREGLRAARDGLEASNVELSRWANTLEERVEERTAAVRESEERFRTIFEASAAGIVATDPTGTIMATNPALERMLGYTKDELKAKNIIALANEADTIVSREALARAFVGDVGLFDIDYRRRDGTLLPARVALAAVLRDEAATHRQRPEMVIAIVEDTTEEKRLHEQLLQSQKMEAVGQLAGGIAHDFNNLLTVITGYSGFAMKRIGETDSELHGQLEQIAIAADRAASLTGQLLAYSRRQVLQPTLINVNDVVTQTGRLLRPLIGEDIEIETKLEPDLHSVKADRGQVEQVLMNLCLNARDAMPDGGRLTVETANVEVDELVVAAEIGAHVGPYVLLLVSDTGCGMDEHTRARAFEPFYTTKEVGEGTGLGLSTVDGIVRQTGGFATVESEPSVGSIFKVYLPQIESPLEEDHMPKDDTAQGNERILVVEDEDTVRSLIVAILHDNGYSVVEARDPAEALERCAIGLPCDLLLTDVVMPQMNGRVLADRIKETQPEIRVLFMSGYTRHVLSDNPPYPGSGFLQKPFNADGLGVKVRELLDAKN